MPPEERYERIETKIDNMLTMLSAYNGRLSALEATIEAWKINFDRSHHDDAATHAQQAEALKNLDTRLEYLERSDATSKTQMRLIWAGFAAAMTAVIGDLASKWLG